MIRKVLITVFCIVATTFVAEAQDFSASLGRYVSNQKKVRTLVAQGVMKIEMVGNLNNPSKDMSYPIKIYMKYPDLFKLVLEGPACVEVVQKGDLITQKILGSNNITTQKADEKSDLFKKYFGYYLDSTTVDSTRVGSPVNVQIDGRSYTKYRVSISGLEKSSAIKTYGTSIDFTEILFDENSLLAGSVIYSDGKEIMRSSTSYILKDDVYVANEIKTTVVSGGMKIVSTISYTAVNVNTPIADREFEIK